jgi:hypothetical protein
MRWYPGLKWDEIPDLPYELWLSCRQHIDMWEGGGGG